jgi:hypothetical protein
MYFVSPIPLVCKNHNIQDEYQYIVKKYFDLLLKNQQMIHVIDEFLNVKTEIVSLSLSNVNANSAQDCLINIIKLLDSIQGWLRQDLQMSSILLLKDLALLMILEMHPLLVMLFHAKQELAVNIAYNILELMLKLIPATGFASIQIIVFDVLELASHSRDAHNRIYRFFISIVSKIIFKLYRQDIRCASAVIAVYLHNIEKQIFEKYSIFNLLYILKFFKCYCALVMSSECENTGDVDFFRMMFEKQLELYGKCVTNRGYEVFINWTTFSKKIVSESSKLILKKRLKHQLQAAEAMQNLLMYFINMVVKKTLNCDTFLESKYPKRKFFLKIFLLEFVSKIDFFVFDENLLTDLALIVNAAWYEYDKVKIFRVNLLLWMVNVFFAARNKIFIVSAGNTSVSATTTYNVLNNFYRRTASLLVNKDIFSLMQLEKQKELYKIFDFLSRDVKSDVFFLEKIAESYQSTVFTSCQIIKNSNFYLSFKTRFANSPAVHEIQQIDVNKYDNNGNIVFQVDGTKETKFDTVSFILGQKTTILRLEMNVGDGTMIADMAKAIIVEHPDYRNETFLVGLFASSAMKNKLSHDGKMNKTWLPIITKQELLNGKIGEIITYHVRLKELYSYVLSMIDPQPANTLYVSGKVLAGKFNVVCLHDNYLRIPLANNMNICLNNCDGAGFIKKSKLGLIDQMLAVSSPYSRRIPSYSYRNVHHINRYIVGDKLYENGINKSVKEGVKRINEVVKHHLSHQKEKRIGIKTLYHTFTAGHRDVEANNFIAIPVSGNKVILPNKLGANEVITIGRPPFDKHTSTIPVTQQALIHEGSSNVAEAACATALKELYGFQYKFTGADASGNMHFFKGIMMVVDDNIIDTAYPEYAGVDMFFNCVDQKICSYYYCSKLQPKHKSRFTLYGVLTPSAIYGPKTFIGIPSVVQKESLGGDYDGDSIVATTFLQDDCFFLMLKAAFEHYKNKDYTNAKILKTFTRTKCNRNILLFRFANIIQATENSYLKGYADCYNIFTILKQEYKILICNGIFALIKMINIIEVILGVKIPVNVDQQEKERLIMMILSKGIRSGTDAYKTMIDWTLLKEFFCWFIVFLKLLNIPRDVVYFKKLSISIHNGVMDVENLLERIALQKKFFECFSLDMLEQSLLHVIGKSKITFNVFMKKRMLEKCDHINAVSNDTQYTQFHALVSSLTEKNNNISMAVRAQNRWMYPAKTTTPPSMAMQLKRPSLNCLCTEINNVAHRIINQRRKYVVARFFLR